MANSAHLDRLVRHHVREARLEAFHEGRHLESIRSLLGEDARREPRARPPRETRTKCVRRSEEVRRGRERPARDTRRLARGRERVLRATLLPPFARPPDATDRRRGLWLAPPSARRPSRALLRMLQWHSPAPRARVRCYKSRGYGSTIHSVPRAGRANGDVFEVFGVVSRVIPFVSHHNTH